MQRVAESQDLIPWTSFMEGKPSEEIFKLQSSTLAASPSRLTITDWATQVISKILHISHAQWIFRNVSLHDTREGYLRTKERNKVLAEIDRISQTDPDSIPERSRYLLEIDFATIPHATAEAQSYWLFAMKAAITAGRRTARSSRQATARQRRARGGGRAASASKDPRFQWETDAGWRLHGGTGTPEALEPPNLNPTSPVGGDRGGGNATGD